MKLPHWALLLAAALIIYVVVFHAKRNGWTIMLGDQANKIKSQLADNPATQWIAQTNY